LTDKYKKIFIAEIQSSQTAFRGKFLPPGKTGASEQEASRRSTEATDDVMPIEKLSSHLML
jgi:hypothetical protein